MTAATTLGMPADPSDAAPAVPARDLAAYYARRAAEYDRIYAKPERQADLRALEGWIATRFAGRRVLELACGTGWWTVHAALPASEWLATDLNPETLALARTKPLAPHVRLAVADALTLDGTPRGHFDAAFAGFWWSHVPRAQLAPWLARLHAHLTPGARLVFIDNRFVSGSSTPISRTDAGGDSWQRRVLADGSVHEVLKNFPTRDEALAALAPHARQAAWHDFGHYWTLEAELA